MTWKKITLVNDDSTTAYMTKRLPDEFIEGDIEQIKLLMSLQDFTNIREMYIQNMDHNSGDDPVDIYRVNWYNDKLEFIPWSFDIADLAKLFPNPQDQASIQLAAMCQRRPADREFVNKLADRIRSA